MNLIKAIKTLLRILIFVFLTIVTQIGGIAYFVSLLLSFRFKMSNRTKRTFLFIGVYCVFTFLLVPLTAPMFGRERVKHSAKVSPTSYMTVLLNRNYVRPELNVLLDKVAQNLKGTAITINYLDANFPYINKFPLLPHLSHNDGKKIDLSLIYETEAGKITDKQLSNSGYGVFAEPKANERNQIDKCLGEGFFQYDYPKYLTLGRKNKRLSFSERGTRELIEQILLIPQLGKLFIEPHLKQRLKLNNQKVRYQGCRSVRHDDHIHIQLK